MPDDIYNAILCGLQKLIALRLRGCPSEDMAQSTVTVWLEALNHVCRWEDGDLPRVQKAFLRLAAECNDWPTPRMFIERLPPRPEPKRLPKPRESKEERAERHALLTDLVKQMRMKR